MPPAYFDYVQVGSALVEKIIENVEGGHSAVILGHNYSGKRQLIEKLARKLSGASFALETLKCADLGAPAQQHLRSLCEKHQNRKSWVLLALDLDSLEQPHSRMLLEIIRTESDKGRLQAIITGESDLRELIHGPKSELTSADHYVLQGLDDDFSLELLKSVLYTLRLKEDVSPEELRALLSRLTGGNTFLIRLLVTAIIETRKSAEVKETTISARELEDSIKQFSGFKETCALLLSATIRLIEEDSGCWENLEHLMDGQPATVYQPRGVPGGLVLSGAAVQRDGALHFSSELMERVIRQYFSSRRIADLYAGAGQWPEAFERYAALDKEEPKIRPINRDDRASVAAALQSLSSSLQFEALRGIPEVKRRFIAGCRYLLGLPEVSFWVRLRIWTPDLRDAPEPTAEAREAARELPAVDTPKGNLELPSPWRECGLMALLDSVRAPRAAVLIGDFRGKEPLSRERAMLAKRLLDNFVTAHTHAVQIERLKRRLETRGKHAQILNSIFETMSHHALDLDLLIRRAADSLRTVGYRRVLICLVNRERTRIQGVYDSSDDRGIDVAKATDYGLSMPIADIQVYIVLTGEAKIIDDASEEPFTAKGVVERARMKSLAIVPIKDRHQIVIGTIHVEREDGKVPSKDETDDLVLFAQQLSTAIQQGDRLRLLEATLDRLPDPIVALDVKGQAHYANRAASRVFDINPSWNEPCTLPPDSELGKGASNALANGSYSQPVAKLQKTEYEGLLKAERIIDWRGQAVGAFVNVSDLNIHLKAVRALHEVPLAKDPASAMQSLLDFAKILKHPWARLYLVDSSDSSVLRGKCGYGFPFEAEFTAGNFTITSKEGEADRRWESIRRNSPMFFRFDPSRPEMYESVSPNGIPIWNVAVQDEKSSLSKKLEECWLDFPLITNSGEVLGKVVLGTDLDLNSQEFFTIYVLSTWVASAFAAFNERERIAAEKYRWIEKAAQLSMAQMAHNMNTKFGAFGPLVGRYRRRESASNGLVALNDDFEALFEKLQRVSLAAKEKLGVVEIRPKRIDISEQIKQTLSENMAEGQWTLAAEEAPVFVNADSDKLDAAFSELIRNARKATALSDSLRIEACLEIDGGSAVIKIADNGPGVPLENKERIFENFFHAYSSANIDGQGLGLNWVRRIVEAHSGQISETGAFGVGARFTIRLPLARQPEQPERDR